MKNRMHIAMTRCLRIILNGCIPGLSRLLQRLKLKKISAARTIGSTMQISSASEKGNIPEILPILSVRTGYTVTAYHCANPGTILAAAKKRAARISSTKLIISELPDLFLPILK